MSSLLLAAMAAWAFQDGGAPGLTVERRVRVVSRDLVNKASEIHRRETVRILGKNVAIDDETFGTRLIVRPDRELAWVIDLHAGTYSELTFDAIRARRRKVLEELAEARARVAGTADAEEIGTILLALGGVDPALPVEVKDTGRKELVAGRACVGRELLIGSDIHYIDVVVDPALTEGRAYFEALAAMGGFHPAVAEKLGELGGFPMKGTVRYALFLDRIVSQDEVISVARGPIAEAHFERPADLKQVPLKGFDPDAGPKPEKPKSLEPSFKEDEIDRENNPLQGSRKE